MILTTRYEYLNHILFWNQTDLECKLAHFKQYYNSERCYLGISGDKPDNAGKNKQNNVLSLNNYRWEKACSDLVQLPRAA